MKAGVLDTDLHILDIAIRYTNASPNLSQLLHKLEHCIGENAEVLNDHSKWSKLKVKRFRMDPNSREVITVMGSSSTEQLGNQVASHADEIAKLDSVDALTVHVRLSSSNEDLEDKNLYSLIKLDRFDKSLCEYTQEFTTSYNYWKDGIPKKVDAYS